MDLAAAVRVYLEQTSGYDVPLHLSRFGLPKAEAEALFSVWDEDYQISRFMLLSRQEDVSPSPQDLFSINSYNYTHVMFRPGIEEFLTSA